MDKKITPLAPTLAKSIMRGQAFSVSTAPQALSLSQIRRDGGTQARDGLQRATLDEYADAMQDGATFPPIIVYHDGRNYWLADGFHRFAAAEQIGAVEIAAEIRSGDQRAAVLHAVGANDAHGLRRTPEDKARAVRRLLEDVEWSQWSDREIARQCRVSHPFVAKIRASTGNASSARKTADGRTMETTGISAANEARRAEPAAIPADFAAERARAVALGFDDLHVVRRGDRTEFMLRRNNDLYAQAGWSIIVAELDRWEQNAAPPAAGTRDGDWTTPDLPEMPDHLWQAEYRWVECTDTLAIIAGPGGWQGNAPTVAGALGLAEDRYAARMPTPQAQPAADDADAIASDIVAAARALGLIARLDGVDLWLYWPSEADSLAQDGDDGGGSLISPWLWPQQAEEVRAWLRDDAPGLAETRQARQEQTAPAPADWRHDPALVQAVARFNDAVRGNDRANVLRAVRAVVAALEAMED